MENLKQKFKERLLSTGREGMENVIKHLERLGFFTAPASTKFHLNIKGGLMQHSWNVCNTALMLREQMIQMKPELAEKLPVESVIIASLLHDVCKSNLQMARDTAPLCTIIQAADGLSSALLED